MKPAPDPAGLHCESLAIVGVGLIGGAVALKARQRGIRRIVGLGRDASRLEAARRAGVIDVGATDPGDLRGVDLAVVCTPVDRIVEDVRTLTEIPDGPRLITDAGSTKGAICESLQNIARFVGSHPIAGSEKRGFEHAAEVQFEGRMCVVTPTESTPTTAVSGVEAFWRLLGMNVTRMSPTEHDAILARTSHFPHLAAYALAGLLESGDERFVAGGFRDTTRIAASDADLWTSILMMNRDAVLETLRGYQRALASFSKDLETADDRSLHNALESARRIRLRLNGNS